MTRDFARTLETATGADSIAALLERAAERAPFSDGARLSAPSQRYRDYAAALRETVGEAEPEPAEDQAALL